MERHAVIPSLFLDGPFHCIDLIIEARLQRGIPRYNINGLGSSAHETIERIRNAMSASGIAFPYMNLSVNLSPVDIRKSGSYLDLPIAVSIILALCELVPKKSLLYNLILGETNIKEKTLFIGELSLSGEIRKIVNLNTILWYAQKKGFKKAIIPIEQLNQAQVIPNLEYYAIKNLQSLLEDESYTFAKSNSDFYNKIEPKNEVEVRHLEYLNLSPRVQKALAMSAAGWHSLLLVGPPGTGKSSVAREILNLLPNPSPEEALEIMILNEGLDNETIRPMRNPHHSSTRRALIGGGVPIQIGEVSRAHNGVLILDELGEFDRNTLQALREPLETRSILISRGSYTVSLPARFLLCGTTNPCPCGNPQLRFVSCSCTNNQRKTYLNKFMGALRDRIDIEVYVEREIKERKDNTEIFKAQPFYQKILSDIKRAQLIQAERFQNTKLRYNSDIELKDIEYFAPLNNEEAKKDWDLILHSTKISYRALLGIRRLARTLADLDGETEIRSSDLLEAASFRCLESIINSEF